MSGETGERRSQPIVECGVDIVEIDRIARLLERFGTRFLKRVYTPEECRRYGARVPQLATRFAAKEAASKALGTGIRGIRWREIEVLRAESGKPVLTLYGQAAACARRMGLVNWSVSLSHSRDSAVAFVVAIGETTA